MFVGHFALAFGAKAASPRMSLGALVAATMTLDLLWPVFLLLGVERAVVDPGNTAFTNLAFVSYPWSHSLLTALGWGALAGVVATTLTKDRSTGWAVGALVVSHWVLDFASHRPDMPVWPGGPKVGLGLWNSIVGTYVIEGSMYVASIVWLLREILPKRCSNRRLSMALI